MAHREFSLLEFLVTLLIVSIGFVLWIPHQTSCHSCSVCEVGIFGAIPDAIRQSYLRRLAMRDLKTISRRLQDIERESRRLLNRDHIKAMFSDPSSPLADPWGTKYLIDIERRWIGSLGADGRPGGLDFSSDLGTNIPRVHRDEERITTRRPLWIPLNSSWIY